MRPDDMILVGVSGGIDSIFLLSLLHKIGQPVTAAVFHHGLRTEADEECEFVTSFCAERGIPCAAGKADVRKYAEENGLGIEEAARVLRYRFLFDTAADRQAAAVATAHHANDQAETVLLHLLRGCGPDGLCGIRPYTLPNAFSITIPLIRPLLGITRGEIEAFAAETGMPYREDLSNEDTAYTRNRVRRDLLPKLEADYNPRIVQALCRLAETAALDKDLLDAECENALRYAAFYGRQGERYISLANDGPWERISGLTGAEWSRKTYCSYPPALRIRILRQILSRMDIDLSETGYVHLKEIDEFFLTARVNQMQPVFRDLWLCCEGEKAKILKDPDEKQWKYPQFSQGWTLSCETVSVTVKELPEWQRKARLHPETAFLDADQLASLPLLRTIRPGERFEPFGLGGRSQKLSDFLVNSKIPARYRRDLAVAADDAGIIWIPGLRVSNRCALCDNTRSVMILKLGEPKTALLEDSDLDQ